MRKNWMKLITIIGLMMNAQCADLSCSDCELGG